MMTPIDLFQMTFLRTERYKSISLRFMENRKISEVRTNLLTLKFRHKVTDAQVCMNKIKTNTKVVDEA